MYRAPAKGKGVREVVAGSGGRRVLCGRGSEVLKLKCLTETLFYFLQGSIIKVALLR